MNIMDRIDFTVLPEGYMPSIARWKIFTEEEAVLARQADNSFEAKVRYVEYYRENDPEYFEKGLKFIDKAIRDFRGDAVPKEEYNQLVIDMIYSLHRFGCSFDEYFLFDYSKLNVDGRAEYITDKVRYYLYNKLNLECNHELFINKAKTYALFKKYYKRQVLEITSDDDYEKFAEFASTYGRFIVKQIDGGMGKGAVILNVQDYSTLRDVFKQIRLMGNVVAEELIVQAQETAKLHPQSVNTVRVPTVKDKNGDVHIFHPFFRMGCGEAVVDNGGSGGILANVDVNTGIINTLGRNELGTRFLIHPDSKEQIIGFQIPRWKEAVAG